MWITNSHVIDIKCSVDELFRLSHQTVTICDKKKSKKKTQKADVVNIGSVLTIWRIFKSQYYCITIYRHSATALYIYII